MAFDQKLESLLVTLRNFGAQFLIRKLLQTGQPRDPATFGHLANRSEGHDFHRPPRPDATLFE